MFHSDSKSLAPQTDEKKDSRNWLVLNRNSDRNQFNETLNAASSEKQIT